jgi:hypothetical protein
MYPFRQTKRHLGCKQRLLYAVIDRIGLEQSLPDCTTLRSRLAGTDEHESFMSSA